MSTEAADVQNFFVDSLGFSLGFEPRPEGKGALSAHGFIGMFNIVRI